MTSSEHPTLDAAYRCVADERRRHVVDYLQGTDGDSASLDDIVDHVIDRESNAPAPEWDTVATDLYHVHLPMLADSGVVDFDPRTEVVRYRGRPHVERIRSETAARRA